MNEVTPEVLRELVSYAPETGELLWIGREPVWFSLKSKRTPEHSAAIWNSLYAGTAAFATALSHGYRSGSLFGRTYYAHRVAWAIYTGRWPEHEIDHINGVPHDNRIANLREATRGQNNSNRGPNAGRSHKGVRRSKNGRRWVADITVSGKAKHIGTFDTEQEAAAAFSAQAEKLHGEFARKLGG